MRRWTILNVLLGLIVMLLGVQIARTWGRALPAVDLAVRPPEAMPRRAEGSGGGRETRGRKRTTPEKQPQTPQAMVVAIVEKDLFDPSRQKPGEEPAPPPPPKEVPPPPNVTVVGIRILGKDREAFLLDASQGGQQKRLRVGDRLGEYTVKTIDPQRVTLAAPSGDSVQLPLTVSTVHGAAAADAARPKQPAPASPAAGVQPPAPGSPPRPPRAAIAPGAMGRPPGVTVTTTTTLPPAAKPTGLPAGVRERLEQLRPE